MPTPNEIRARNTINVIQQRLVAQGWVKRYITPNVTAYAVMQRFYTKDMKYETDIEVVVVPLYEESDLLPLLWATTHLLIKNKVTGETYRYQDSGVARDMDEVRDYVECDICKALNEFVKE